MAVSRNTRAARWGGALLVALAPLPWLGMGTAVATQGGQPGNESKVTICHRTNAVNNPYVVITVNQSAVDGDLGNNKGRGDHYAEHKGPVFDPEADYPPPMSDDDWGDIIPPIQRVHSGLNWTADGIAIYENGCKVPTTVTSSPPVTSSSPAEDKVTLCHRTNSVKNPYVVITVNVSAADGDATNGNGDHYLEHNGPLFDPEADYQPPFSGDEWGDIIPPIEGAHDGLNWTTEGIAFYENGCNVPTTVTSSPPVTSSSPAEDKVTLCHRTNSVTNPYVVITVDVSAADGDATNGNGDHYLEHNGPLFDPEADYQPPFSGDEWGDIIPPIEGAHDGLNWTAEGIAAYERGCVFTVPTEVSSSAGVSPSTSLSTPPKTTKPPKSPKPTEIETTGKGNPPSSSSPEATEIQTSAGALPKTGPGAPLAGALGISLLLIGVGVLLLLGPGRLIPTTYHRKH